MEIEIEERRTTRVKIPKKYFVEEDSEDEDPPPKRSKDKKHSDDEDSDDEDFNDEDFSDEDRPHKNKQSKEKSRKLTEYEMMVQKNRDEKMAFLDSLKINEIKSSFSEAVMGLKPKRRKREKRSPSPIIPRTNQQRSAKVKMNLSEKAMETKAMEAYEPLQPTRKILPQVLPFKEALEEEELYENFSRDFGDLEEYSTEPFKNYDSHFHRMQLLENQVAPFKDSMVSCLSFHPMREKLIIASAGSKYGKIGLWNVDSDSDPYVFETHTEGITHIKFNHECPNMIVSSSYDGTVRCGDLEKRVFNEVFNVSKRTGCTYFDFVSSDTVLVGQRNGNVSVVDLRRNSKTTSKAHPCHDALVKSVSVHPLDKNYFISAEYEGFIRLWDLRQLKTKPVYELIDPNKGVMSAFFSPLSGKQILTSSNGQVCIYYSPILTGYIFPKNTLRCKSKGCDKKLFLATWLPNKDDAFVIGSKSFPRRIQIFNDSMKNIFNYENLQSTSFYHTFHPSLSVMAGVRPSGRIFMFADRSV